MPSWVELCFLDMAFRPVGLETNLTEIHVFGVPGYKRMSGQLVISPSVQNFLRTFMVDILFRQSALIEHCPFQKMQVWLYDSAVSDEERTYDLPPLAADTFTLESAIKTARLKVIHVLRASEAGVDEQNWEIVVETLLSSLFAEFIEMPAVPLYFIKNPTLENERRPVSTVNISPSAPQELLFNSMIVRTERT